MSTRGRGTFETYINLKYQTNISSLTEYPYSSNSSAPFDFYCLINNEWIFKSAANVSKFGIELNFDPTRGQFILRNSPYTSYGYNAITIRSAFDPYYLVYDGIYYLDFEIGIWLYLMSIPSSVSLISCLVFSLTCFASMICCTMIRKRETETEALLKESRTLDGINKDL
jgi:hypothetical protein